MLRIRDMLAALAVVSLTRMAYDDPSESLSASVQLSFYVGRDNAAASSSLQDNGRRRLGVAPVVLDVDGDGTVEALAALTHNPHNAQTAATWWVQVLDLKPAASKDKTHMAPFRPTVLYEAPYVPDSNEESGTPIVPIQSVTGHVQLTASATDNVSLEFTGGRENKMMFKGTTEINDRNRHYFCGTDWHEASQKCSLPCPKGTSDECPSGEYCYADTPCDITHYHRRVSAQQKRAGPHSVDNWLVTPVGGLPSIFTAWSNGVVSMHSLTGHANQTTSEDESNSNNSSQNTPLPNLLGVHFMWDTRLLDDGWSAVEWEEVSLTFLDSTDASDASGMLIIQAYVVYAVKNPQNDDEAGNQGLHFVKAVDARSGTLLWDASLSDEDETHEAIRRKLQHENFLLPVTPAAGLTSWARRRSGIPHIATHKQHQLPANCLHTYRRSLFDSGALPHLYWGSESAEVNAYHFEHQPHNRHQKKHHHAKDNNNNNNNNARHDPVDASKEPPKQLKWDRDSIVETLWTLAKMPFETLDHEMKAAQRKKQQQKRRPAHRQHHHNSHHGPAVRGRPNVLVRRDDRGLEVRSLKNGRSVCHLTLWEETLYTDLNQDGILDGVFIVTGDHLLEDDGDGLSDENYDATGTKWVNALARRVASISEAEAAAEIKKQATAEQSQKLCHLMALSGVPTKEELYTVNLCGSNYFKEHPDASLDAAPLLAVEALYGKGQDVIVALNDKFVHRFRGTTGRKIWQTNGRHHEDFPSFENGYLALLERIHVSNAVPSARPIIFSGEDGLALLSPGRGGVLATAAFPQPVIHRPLLVDFNGDGTTDVIAVTKDAIWGFQVVVRTGSSIFFRIAVGLLLLGIMLALLRNRFGPHPGRRSTDA